MPRTATGQFRAETPWERSKRQRREARAAQRAAQQGRQMANAMAMHDVAAAARAHAVTA